MSITKKLILMIATGLLALICITLFSWIAAKANEAAYKEMFRTDYRQVELTQGALNHLGLAVQSFKDCLLRNDPKYVEEFNQHVASIETSLKEYIPLADPDETKLAEQTLAVLGTYRTSINELVKARATSDDIAAIDRTLAKGIDKPIRAALENLGVTNRKNIDTARQDIQKQTDMRLYIQIAATTAAGIFLFTFGTILGRGIRNRIRHFSGIIDQVADNDLTVQVDVSTRDEIGHMGMRLNAMLVNLREIVSTMNDTASQVSTASTQLSMTSEQIATGAEEVSAQAQTVGTASEQMASTSADIAHNCNMVAESARRANISARDGAMVVETTIISMSSIAEKVAESARTVEGLGKRSDQIGAIIETIEDIADQTNLLALNAAIEAARAGEQGRGFAVVADEVRALAERTTKATREIDAMIKAIQSETRTAVISIEEGVREVEQGNEGAERSAAALQEILDKIGEVTRDINQIATAAEEQTATTHEISNNILQMSQVVEDTSRGSQESATAASQLASLAGGLQHAVSRFRFA